MATEDKKTYTPEEIDEETLPESVVWENVVDAPQSLAELSPTDGERLDTVESTVVTGLGDIAIQGWVFDGTFSATDNDTVAWSAGTLKFKDGQTYSIGAGNTGNMGAITYVFFDLGVSTTAFQITTTSINAVGANRLQVAVAQNVTAGKSAIFQAFGGKGGVGVLLTASNIAANSITANEIQTNTITTLNLTAGTISGMTITGGTIRTSSGSTRVEMSGANNDIRIYSSGVLRAQGYDQGWDYFDESGALVGSLYASSNVHDNAILLAGDLNSDGKIFYGVGYSGYHSFHVGSIGSDSTLRMSIQDGNVFMGDVDNPGTFTIDMIGTLNVERNLNIYDGSLGFDLGGFVNLAQMTGSTASGRSDYQDGSMYYRSDVGDIRVRVAGAWKTVVVV